MSAKTRRDDPLVGHEGPGFGTGERGFHSSHVQTLDPWDFCPSFTMKSRDIDDTVFFLLGSSESFLFWVSSPKS